MSAVGMITIGGLIGPRSTHCHGIVLKSIALEVKAVGRWNSTHGFFVLNRGKVLLTVFLFLCPLRSKIAFIKRGGGGAHCLRNIRLKCGGAN